MGTEGETLPHHTILCRFYSAIYYHFGIAWRHIHHQLLTLRIVEGQRLHHVTREFHRVCASGLYRHWYLVFRDTKLWVLNLDFLYAFLHINPGLGCFFQHAHHLELSGVKGETLQRWSGHHFYYGTFLSVGVKLLCLSKHGLHAFLIAIEVRYRQLFLCPCEQGQHEGYQQ